MKTIAGVQRRLGELYNYISLTHREKKSFTKAESHRVLNHIFHEVTICLKQLADIRKQIKGSLEE